MGYTGGTSLQPLTRFDVTAWTYCSYVTSRQSKPFDVEDHVKYDVGSRGEKGGRLSSGNITDTVPAPHIA